MRIYSVFSTILNMTLTASIVILVVLSIRIVLRFAPKIFSYALWAIVLFRLLCPLSPTFGFSLLNVIDVPVTGQGNIEYISTEITHSGSPTFNFHIYGDSTPENIPSPNEKGQIIVGSSVSPISLAIIVWLIGIVVMSGYSAILLIKLRHKLIGAVPLRDNILLADHIATPFVLGLFRPKIYFPSTLTEAEQIYIAQHEQHHIKRGDHIIRILSLVALCIHWFNPLVWIAFILSSKDMEMSCDEAVIKETTVEIRADYATSLLRFSAGRKTISATPLAFGEGDIKSRIKNVMCYKKPRNRITILAFIIFMLASISLITNPSLKGKILMTIYDNYKQLSVDGSLICLESGEITEPYFCYPVNAEPIGFEGNILYCFIPEYGDMVFASNPGSITDTKVYPVAKDFTDFLRLILACGSTNPIEQSIWMNKEQFNQHLQEEIDNRTVQQKEVLDFIMRELNLAPMENPFEYVKSVQIDFDDSKIKFSDDYYDTLGLARPDGTKVENSFEFPPITFSFHKTEHER